MIFVNSFKFFNNKVELLILIPFLGLKCIAVEMKLIDLYNFFDLRNSSSILMICLKFGLIKQF